MSLARRLVPPLVSGTLFGAGLTLSGMTDPARVRGFLDLFGNWDPTLAFVMGGAVSVMAVAWLIRAKMAKPLFGEKFSLPDRGDFDRQLLIGSALFGIGWGIAGLCPGPALASLALSPGAVLPFVAAMIAGMAIHSFSRSASSEPNTKEHDHETGHSDTQPQLSAAAGGGRYWGTG